MEPVNTITKSEMYNYLQSVYNAAPYYMWGFDMEVITPARMEEKYAKFGKDKYDKNTLSKKFGYYGCDCSGLMTPITGRDQTAQAWYNSCAEKGVYKNCPSDYALVFRKNAKGQVVHMGVLIGTYTYEMYNRLDKKIARGGNWTHYGIPNILVQEIIDLPNYYVTEDKEKIVVETPIAGYTTAMDAIAEKNKACNVPVGNYFIYKTVDIDGEMCYNITSRKGCPGSWITPIL